jgi:hypothetical protein
LQISEIPFEVGLEPQHLHSSIASFTSSCFKPPECDGACPSEPKDAAALFSAQLAAPRPFPHEQGRASNLGNQGAIRQSALFRSTFRLSTPLLQRSRLWLTGGRQFAYKYAGE